MLQKFVKGLVSIFFSASLIANEKKDAQGICYVAGPRRYMSILLDLIIIYMILYFFSYLHQFFNYLITNPEILIHIEAKYPMHLPLSTEEKIAHGRIIILSIFMQILECIILFSYILYSWLKFSTTPGKLLFRLKVVDASTFKKITLKQAVKRSFVLVMLSVIPILIGGILIQLHFDSKIFMLLAIPLPLSYILANFDKHRQAWHDKFAGTVVVTSKSLPGTDL